MPSTKSALSQDYEERFKLSAYAKCHAKSAKG